MLKIREAKKELAEKSYRDIQESTAWTWASRGVASYQNVMIVSKDKKMAYYLLAEEYSHEAREHAALVEAGASSLLSQVQAAIVPHALKAWNHIEDEFGI
jgi:hypothetical protein